MGFAAITVGSLGPFPPRPEPGSGFGFAVVGLDVGPEADWVVLSVPDGEVVLAACGFAPGFSLEGSLAFGGGGGLDPTGGVVGLEGGLGEVDGAAGGLTAA
jgi:hypothetical protein